MSSLKGQEDPRALRQQIEQLIEVTKLRHAETRNQVSSKGGHVLQENDTKDHWQRLELQQHQVCESLTSLLIQIETFTAHQKVLAGKWLPD